MTEDRRRKEQATYKFQNLQVYKLAIEYLDGIYYLADKLPGSEKFNLRQQLVRAGTSIVPNIAEGSTGQSDPEQHRFLGLALRSYIETVACLEIIERRNFISQEQLVDIRSDGYELFIKLLAFRRSLKNHAKS